MAYHEEMHDYPKRSDELRPRYLSTDVPLHDEKYPESLRGLWVNYQYLDPQLAPIYQRIDKDHFVSYKRIDQDNYSLLLISHGKFAEVESQDVR
jgi:hypothetical protein